MGEIAREGDKDRTIITILAVSAGVLLIAVLAFIIVPLIISHNEAKSMASFNIAPQSAIVEINGKEYRTGAYEFEPGKYHATIKKDGFESKEIDFEVSDHKTTIVNSYILNEQGFDYFEYSENDLAVLRRIQDKEVLDFISQYDSKLKVRDVLPIEGTFDANAGKANTHSLFLKYQITNGEMSGKCQKVFCLVVNGYKTSRPLLEKSVAEELKKRNFQINDYEVVYDLE